MLHDVCGCHLVKVYFLVPTVMRQPMKKIVSSTFSLKEWAIMIFFLLLYMRNTAFINKRYSQHREQGVPGKKNPFTLFLKQVKT